MHLDFIHHTTAADNTQIVINIHAQNAAFYILQAWVRGQEIKPHRLQHRWLCFHFPDNISLGFHCLILPIIVPGKDFLYHRSATTWLQTRGPSGPVLSPASSEVKWDAINCTEYAKRRSYTGNLCSQALKSRSKSFNG